MLPIDVFTSVILRPLHVTIHDETWYRGSFTSCAIVSHQIRFVLHVQIDSRNQILAIEYCGYLGVGACDGLKLEASRYEANEKDGMSGIDARLILLLVILLSIIWAGWWADVMVHKQNGGWCKG